MDLFSLNVRAHARACLLLLITASRTFPSLCLSNPSIGIITRLKIQGPIVKVLFGTESSDIYAKFLIGYSSPMDDSGK